MDRVLQVEKLNSERGQKRSKITFLSLKMIIFGHFSRFLAFHFQACATLNVTLYQISPNVHLE